MSLNTPTPIIRPPGRRCPPATVLAAAGLAGLLSIAICQSNLGAQTSTPEQMSGCTAREVSRDTLRLQPGVEAYVEPRYVVAAGDEIMVTGKPTYTWDVRATPVGMLSRNDLFGIIAGADGRTRVVPPPFPAALVKPAAVAAVGEAAWAFILFEVRSGTDTTNWYTVRGADGGRVQRLWYAEYRNDTWSGFQSIPFDGVSEFLDLTGSPLVIQGDTAMWVVPVAGPDSWIFAASFERVGGTWTVQRVVNRRGATPAYASLAYLPEAGFILGIVQAYIDPDVRDDRNSYIVYGRADGWQPLHRIVAGLEDPVFYPTLYAHPGGIASLSWINSMRSSDAVYEGLRARTLSGYPHLGPHAVSPPRTIAKLHADYMATVATSRGPVWLVHAAGSPVQLVLLEPSPSGAPPKPVWQVPTPYEGLFGAAMVRDSEILIAGPLLDAAAPKVVTLMIRLRLDCPVARR
jgi:hypothetical protein